MTVPAVTIDDLVTEAGTPSVSLVKIDVQGAELLVLEGAKRTLDKMRPVLFVEVDDRALGSFGASAQALVTRIEGAGYEMYELAYEGALFDTDDYSLYGVPDHWIEAKARAMCEHQDRAKAERSAA